MCYKVSDKDRIEYMYIYNSAYPDFKISRYPLSRKRFQQLMDDKSDDRPAPRHHLTNPTLVLDAVFTASVALGTPGART